MRRAPSPNSPVRRAFLRAWCCLATEAGVGQACAIDPVCESCRPKKLAFKVIPNVACRRPAMTDEGACSKLRRGPVGKRGSVPTGRLCCARLAARMGRRCLRRDARPVKGKSVDEDWGLQRQVHQRRGHEPARPAVTSCPRGGCTFRLRGPQGAKLQGWTANTGVRGFDGARQGADSGPLAGRNASRRCAFICEQCSSMARLPPVFWR